MASTVAYMETWKDIVGAPGYEVSDRGRVRSPRRLLVVNKSLRYDRVKLGRWREEYVHRLVLETFIGPCPRGHQCRHLNGNPRDNSLQNLRWGTASEDAGDRAAHGTIRRAGDHWAAKMTSEDVRRIRHLRNAGLTYAALGRAFRISKSQAHRICAGDNWCG